MNIPENFSPRARRVVEFAKRASVEFGARVICVEHLLLGLFRLEEGVAYEALVRMGLHAGDLQAEIVEKLKKDNVDKTPPGEDPDFTIAVESVFVEAEKIAKHMEHSYVGTEHLLLAFVALRLLEEKISYNDLREHVEQILHIDKKKRKSEKHPKIDGREIDEAERLLRSIFGSRMEPPKKEKKDREDDNPPNEEEDFPEDPRERRERRVNSAVKAFCTDLTKEATEGRFDPLIGRDDEVRQVIEVLCRRRKSNPVLLGEAGVGKTAVVEGLAQAIAEKRVPEILQGKRVISLAINDMLAGTQYRGQFEARIKALIEEIQAAKNIILFIDEIHTIVGAGKSEGSPGDAANILKPALSRGDFQCIGATTLNEYRKFIEKDAALERRFQSITIDPPNEEEAINILKGVSGRYESFHSCVYLPEALEAAVRYSQRYIPDRNLPDKAIDIIDQAGARARLSRFEKPKKFIELEQDIEKFDKSRKAAVENGDLERARDFRNMRDKQKEALENLLNHWRERQEKKAGTIDVDRILEVVSEIAKVPVSRMSQSDAKRLLGLEERLHKSVVAQNEACSAIARALRRSRANLKDPRRPIGSFLFLGPTGVGKTLLAKTLAEELFGTSDSLIQIDMSEYMEKINVSRLIGSAPGYIGYEEGGRLTEAVRRKPYSVVLFDEIEKAHPDAIQLLLQVLEEGKLSDSLGRKVDFRNTVVIMTSNVGAEALQRNSRMGFGDVGTAADYEGAKAKISEEMKRVFKPEFLNRLTDYIFFRQLSKSDLGSVIKIEVEKLGKRLESRGITLNLTKAAYDFLVEVGYDEKYGARPLRRAVERYLEDPLSEEILRNSDKRLEGEILVDVRENALVFQGNYKSEESKKKSGRPNKLIVSNE
ncbi:MAG: ATP-dependent Clp protease ATP-binding subunit [Opitutales bacterium]|nr:ATP-dependent Clp protease ATP-binding subunit [Opitutales bacterium]